MIMLSPHPIALGVICSICGLEGRTIPAACELKVRGSAAIAATSAYLVTDQKPQVGASCVQCTGSSDAGAQALRGDRLYRKNPGP